MTWSYLSLYRQAEMKHWCKVEGGTSKFWFASLTLTAYKHAYTPPLPQRRGLLSWVGDLPVSLAPWSWSFSVLALTL